MSSTPASDACSADQGGVGEAARPWVRLLSFLGNGAYRSTCYEGCGEPTRYVGQALARRFRVDEVCVLATEGAWKAHGESLSGCLEADGAAAWRVPIPEGSTEGEMWTLFRVLKGLLRLGAGGRAAEAVPATLAARERLAAEGAGEGNAVPPLVPARTQVRQVRVVLDITHGFRSQPFFAAACIAFVRAVDTQPCEIQVVYGSFDRDAAADAVHPIWDLTPVIELLDWTQALTLFTKSGVLNEHIDARLAPLVKLDRHQRAEVDTRQAQLYTKAIKALRLQLQRFADDLATVRVGALVFGEDNARPRRAPSARMLSEAIGETAELMEQHLPPLADVLSDLRGLADSLCGTSLATPGAFEPLGNLVDLYTRWNRHAEAVSVLRESSVSLFARPAGRMPGLGLDEVAREQAESLWSQTKAEGKLRETRNDIQHAGFRSEPQDPARLLGNIRASLEDFRSKVSSAAFPTPDQPAAPSDLAERVRARVECAYGREVAFDDLPDCFVALDGYTIGCAVDLERRRFSFDHHDRNLRFAMRSTCEQVLEARVLGLDFEGLTLGVNALDSDTVLSVLLALCPELVTGRQLAVTQQLVRAVGALDSHGPAAAETDTRLALAFVRRVMGSEEPPRDSATMVTFLQDAVRAAYAFCLQPEAEFEPREKVYTVLAHDTQHGVVLVQSEDWIFDVAYQIAPRVLAVQVQSDGSVRCSLGKRSDFVAGFDIPALVAALNEREAVREQELGEEHATWGGATSVAGAPRRADGRRSLLSVDEIWQVVSESLASRAH